jgi:hypothetical protein
MTGKMWRRQIPARIQIFSAAAIGRCTCHSSLLMLTLQSRQTAKMSQWVNSGHHESTPRCPLLAQSGHAGRQVR